MEEPVKESPALHVTTPTSPRPAVRPSGPRSRRALFKSAVPLSLSNGNGNTSPSDETVSAYSDRNSPTSQAGGSRPQSPSMPTMPSLSQLSEAAILIPTPFPHRREQREQGVQACLPDNMSSRLPSRSSTPAVKVLLKPPTLEPPPALAFESTPVAWKGLTLQAAQWTFSSEQLQDIVSRAIRMSAQEGFIKLLSVKTLDEEFVQELQKLDQLKATTQSQYRFNMHRRSMLLQSLLALAAGGESDNAALVTLTTQLADITVACDRLMETMLRIADQRAQILHLQDVHISSALAMALRKLNGSYAKRTGELKEARAQIDQLKAELEEAWNVAEDMAQEMDDLDNFHSGFSSGGEGDADDTASELLKASGDETLMDASVRMARVVPILGHAVASKATLTNLGEEPGPSTFPLPASPGPDKEMDRTTRVSAAKKRSSRTSKASLRIPKTPTGTGPTADRASVFSKRSRSKSLRGVEPPVPSVPIDSFLEMSETRPTSPAHIDGQQPAPPVPHLPTSSDIAPPLPPKSPRPSSPHFEIPPITIDYAEESAQQRSLSARRIKSMQPPARARSMDDSDVDTAATRRVSKAEYKKFDGWPWGGGGPKKKKRHSLPLTRLSLDEAKKDAAEKALGSFKRDTVSHFRLSSLSHLSLRSSENVENVPTGSQS
ncbi:hypothetical protein EIP91_012419 [Steccherinum ochraceum]|uniref:Uncharacterized protein n=1 Tax=Steccherinum ochraceum TaxID=92696 RepID=A0A4R0RWV0_9APHY|nr:hypothetical protein EIP91_012419 [Steccherinum ochraceum]